MDQGADARRVDLVYRSQLVRVERRNIGRLRILRGLCGVAGAWNHASHFSVIEDPTQSKVGHRHIRRNHFAKFFHRVEGHVEIDSGKRFTAIESLSMAVEAAVVAGGELRLAGDFAGEQAAGKRQSSQNAHSPGRGKREEHFARTLAEW